MLLLLGTVRYVPQLLCQVGTKGTVKAMLPEAVESTGADIVLGNTYHLMLQPTAERIAQLGGLRKFMNWSKPVLLLTQVVFRSCPYRNYVKLLKKV